MSKDVVTAYSRFGSSGSMALFRLILACLLTSTAEAQLNQRNALVFLLPGGIGGRSTAISSDGGTLALGAPGENSGGGAWHSASFDSSSNTWVFKFTLAGTGAVGNARQGFSVALSGDGNTAVAGGPGDNGGIGASWAFTRDSTGTWMQQGSKLVGAGASGAAQQGSSIDLARDGQTAIIGAPFNNCSGSPTGGTSCVGGAFVFVNVGGAWSQQGPMLVGSGAIGGAFQGASVALSADGNTALIGGPGDNCSSFACSGATWVFARSNGTWTQQAKLVGAGGVPSISSIPTGQGFSVALSNDGNTALSGAPNDSKLGGAFWIYQRSGTTWTQQGAKLVGSGAVGAAGQGWSASLSGDGNTALSGAPFDNNGTGATWVFTGSNGMWSQLDSKLVGTGAVGFAQQGYSVSLSADASTAAIGGPNDSNGTGAAWVFTQPTTTNAPPTIYQTTPDQGVPQDVIDIRGHGFDPNIKNDVVKFGAAVATIQWEKSDPDHDTLRADVPVISPTECGSSSTACVVLVTVTVDGRVSNSKPFTVR
jgi:hypothetical protein